MNRQRPTPPPSGDVRAEPRGSARFPRFDLPARWRWLLFGVVLAACAIRFLARAEIVLDDSFIYLDIARNWLLGHGPRFNPGDQHLLASGPGWLTLLTATKAVLPGAAWEAVALGLGFACLVAACAALHLLLAQRHPLAAAMAPIAIFWAPSVLGVIGNDTAFATAAGLWLLRARQAKWWPALAPLAALFYLARGEGAVLGAAVLASAVLAGGLHWRAVGRQLRSMIGGIVGGMLLLAAWHVYFYLEFNALLPSTLAAKLAMGQAGLPQFAVFLPDVFWNNVGNPWLAAAGALALLIHVSGLPAWAAIHCGLLSLLGIAAYHWYFYPLELVLLTANLVGLDLAAALLLSLPWRRIVPSASTLMIAPVLAVATVVGAWFLYVGEDVVFSQLTVRRDTYRDASTWMLGQAMTLPLESHRRPRLLTDEIGMLSFYLPGFEVRDTMGLATPLADPADVLDVARAVERLHPDFLLLPGSRNRTEMVLVGENGWQVFPVAYRPEPGLWGRFVMLGSPDWVPEESPSRRVIDLARMTRQPLRVNGELGAVEVPDVGICLFAHPSSQLAYDLADGDSKDVVVGFGMLDSSWQDGNATDGAGFAINAIGADGKAERVFARTLRPMTEPGDRGVQTATIPLPDGTRELHLSTDSAGNANWDWCYWVEVVAR